MNECECECGGELVERVVGEDEYVKYLEFDCLKCGRTIKGDAHVVHVRVKKTEGALFVHGIKVGEFL
jgi:hypothetical protein